VFEFFLEDAGLTGRRLISFKKFSTCLQALEKILILLKKY